MRICFMMVDLPDSPAPNTVHTDFSGKISLRRADYPSPYREAGFWRSDRGVSCPFVSDGRYAYFAWRRLCRPTPSLSPNTPWRQVLTNTGQPIGIKSYRQYIEFKLCQGQRGWWNFRSAFTIPTELGIQPPRGSRIFGTGFLGPRCSRVSKLRFGSLTLLKYYTILVILDVACWKNRRAGRGKGSEIWPQWQRLQEKVPVQTVTSWSLYADLLWWDGGWNNVDTKFTTIPFLLWIGNAGVRGWGEVASRLWWILPSL